MKLSKTQKTYATKKDDIQRKWWVVDVKGLVLGRAAAKIASLLIGKNKPYVCDHLDCGDFVIVVNASKIELTRNKADKKVYRRHSGYPGGLKEIPFKKAMEKRPEWVIEQAVSKMLPKNKFRDQRMSRLFVYADDTHPHEAQKPESVKLASKKHE